MDGATLESDAGAAETRPTPASGLSVEARRDFAVVVPALNEAPVVPELIKELRETFDRFDLDGEVILVDDGSSDGTAEIARREAAGWSNLRVLSHPTNLGKTEAMVTAADATDREYLILFDADLQHLPEEIPRFLEKLQEGWDMVTGRKVGAYDKKAVSGIYNALSRRIFRVPVSDLNSMKAFRSPHASLVRLSCSPCVWPLPALGKHQLLPPPGKAPEEASAG